MPAPTRRYPDMPHPPRLLVKMSTSQRMAIITAITAAKPDPAKHSLAFAAAHCSVLRDLSLAEAVVRGIAALTFAIIAGLAFTVTIALHLGAWRWLTMLPWLCAVAEGVISYRWAGAASNAHVTSCHLAEAARDADTERTVETVVHTLGIARAESKDDPQ